MQMQCQQEELKKERPVCSDPLSCFAAVRSAARARKAKTFFRTKVGRSEVLRLVRSHFKGGTPGIERQNWTVSDFPF